LTIERTAIYTTALLWLYYFMIERHYLFTMWQGGLQFVDLLFALPLVLMMGLVSVIIIIGILRLCFCFLGCLSLHGNL
jgi:hypothetical protein